MNWYAIHVETGKEELVKSKIQKKLNYECSCLFPKRELMEKKNGVTKNVLKPMFPGYLLLRTDMNFETYYQLKDLTGVLRLLNNNKARHNPIHDQESSYFQAISEDEIEVLNNLLDNNGVINFSTLIINNSEITVKSGPLKNLEDKIIKINKRKKRAKVKIQIHESVKVIEVGVLILE
nr:antiterminator LoaP [Paenibacillus xylanexedens]